MLACQRDSFLFLTPLAFRMTATRGAMDTEILKSPRTSRLVQCLKLW